MNTRFLHSGNIGDLLWAIPSMKALAKGGQVVLVLKPGRWAGYSEGLIHPLKDITLSVEYIESFRPLAEANGLQVEVWKQGCRFDFDMDRFRSPDERIDLGRGNIGGWYKFIQPVSYDLSVPWLSVPADPRSAGRLLIHATHRYRNPRIKYGFLRDYKPLMVGLENEVELFQQQAGFRPEWIQTKDFLELAQVIAGARLVVANQSVGISLAQSMQVPRVLEVCDSCPNVQLSGRIAYESMNQKHFTQCVARAWKDTEPGH